MSWLQLATGDELSLTLPSPAHITPYAMAWGLSQINRYCGQCLRPYSVAEHSLLVCEIAERELGLNVHGQFAALLHDGHEFIATDMHSPGKRSIGQKVIIDRAEHFKRAGLLRCGTDGIRLRPAPLKACDRQRSRSGWCGSAVSGRS